MDITSRNMNLSSWKESMAIWLLRIPSYLIVIVTLLIFGKIACDGIAAIGTNKFPFVNTDILTKNPETLHVVKTADGEIIRLGSKDFLQWKQGNPDRIIVSEKSYSYSAGGVLGPLVGTGLLVLVAISVSLFIGVSTAVFLSEYSRDHAWVSAIRLAIMNLAGVPSIVFGLFGFGFFCLTPIFPVITGLPNAHTSIASFPIAAGVFVSFQGWGISFLSGGCTLAIMILPVIISACEESLRAVPKGFREASLALGASRWKTIRKVVLPYAFPGILTASVLGITRVAGETAPIMLTAAVADKDNLPWDTLGNSQSGHWLLQVGSFFQQSVQAMPYHIYTMVKLPQTPENLPAQHAAVFVFLLFVCGFALLSVLLRTHLRRRIKW